VLFVIVWVGLEMNSHGEEEQQIAFEIYVVVAKRNVEEEDENCDCIEFLMKELRNVGVIVEIEFLA
jgi:anoctamin-10